MKISDNLKKGVLAFVGCLAFFMLGAYVSGDFSDVKITPIYKYIITGFIGVFCISLAVIGRIDEK